MVILAYENESFSFIINNLLNSSRSICTIRDEKDFENPVIENINYEEKYDYILTDGKYPKETLELMKKNPNAITIIDAGRFNKYTKTLVKEIDIVICSKAFAKGITQTENCETDEEYIKLYKDTQRFVKNPKRLVITIGDKGYICEKDGEAVIVPAYNPTEPIIETTGAGDIFHGAFTHAISNNYDFHDALEFANITASLSTTKKGARYSCPNLQTVENIYHNMHINEDIYNKANYSETGKKLLLAPDLNDDVKSRML